MGKLIDLTGQRFGHLTVIERGDDYISPSGIPTPKWKCTKFFRTPKSSSKALWHALQTCVLCCSGISPTLSLP